MEAKVTCGIIEDILPNYIDGLTGEESNKAIKEHLDECESCRKKLEVLNSDISIDKPPQKETEPFKKIRRLGIILLLVTFVVGIIIGGISIFATEKSTDDAVLTLVFLCIAIVIISFQFIVPIAGISVLVIRMKKNGVI